MALGDGAEWIWKLVREHYSDALQILDFYHASEHVWDVARAAYGADSEAAAAWAHTCTERLETEGVPGLLRSWRELPTRELTPEARQVLRGELQYFRHNRRRMRYPTYRQAGLMIGSGPVEAGCKVVVGHRLKGAGMRWSQSGATAVLAIRTALLSGRPDLIQACARAA